MAWHLLLPFVPLLVLVGCAAATDIRHRRIPNALTLMLAATGLMQSLTHCRTVSFGQALAGLAAGAALTLALYLLGALGGGDVKLFGGMGAWLGPALVLQVFAMTALAGAVLVLIHCAVRRRLGALVRNSALVAVNLVHITQVGVDHASATGAACRSVDRPLPYALPALLALLALPLVGRWMP